MKKFLALVLVLTMALGFTVYADEAAEDETAEEHFVMQEMRIESDYGSIYGEMYLPDVEQDSYPTVILVHGFNGILKTNVPYAQAYAEAGFAAYVFDFVNGGKRSQSGDADGTLLGMSVLTEYDQLVTVIDAITELEYVDSDNLFLLGGSMGGWLVSYTTPRLEDRIKADVLLYPAFNMRNMIFEVYENEDEVPETFDLMGSEVSKLFYTDLAAIDIYSELENITCDVIIIHGDSDLTVPISYSEDALAHLQSVSLVPIEGGAHGLSNKDHSHRNQAIEASLNFLLEEVNK